MENTNIPAENMVTISIHEYNSLRDRETLLRDQLATESAVRISLENRLEEKEKQEPKIILTKGNRWGGVDDTKEFINMEFAKSLWEKEYKDELSKELDSLKSENVNLKREISNLETSIEDHDERHSTYISRMNRKHYEQIESNNEEYAKKVKSLKEEITKIKENKTDIEVETKRNKEIGDLKLRIKTLEKQIDSINSLPWYKRFVYNKQLVKDINKELREIAQNKSITDSIGYTWVNEENKVRENTGSRFNPMASVRSWFTF